VDDPQRKKAYSSGKATSSGAGEAAVSAEASQLLGCEGIGTVLVRQHRVTDLSHDDHYDEFEGKAEKI